MTTGDRGLRPVDGILLLDKPLGISSNQALQRVKRLFRARKAGHTGSLDPLASGMLPVCLGQATKVSAYLLDSDKFYRFRLRFGTGTTTGDLEGEVTSSGPGEVSQAALLKALSEATGSVMQVPPMYSALKHQGRRLYELARAGQTVEREPRRVTIHALELAAYEPGSPTFVVRCSKGTYVRTLAEDLARALGTVAHVIELRRLCVAPFEEDPMVTLEEVESAFQDGPEALDGLLIPLDRAVRGMPRLDISASDALLIRQGQTIWPGITSGSGSLVRLYDQGRRFLGIGSRQMDGRVDPHRLMATGPLQDSHDFGL